MTRRILFCLIVLSLALPAACPLWAAPASTPPLPVARLQSGSEAPTREAARPYAGPAADATIAALLASATQVDAGYEHTCAVTITGGLKCWGNNDAGQLGDGTTTDRVMPVDVSGLTSGVVAVAAGYEHTCAVTSSGGVKCWGGNYWGQLGDGTTTDSTTPVDVSGLASGVMAVATGDTHTCALTSGGVKCWGANGRGQLGDGTTTDSTTPVDIVGLASGVVAVAAGGWHTCALTSSGGARCWGANYYGQLGDGTTIDSTTPVDVSGLASGVVAVAAGGDHTCAVTNSGGVKCWGWNYSGQLGDGTTTDSTTPVDVSGLESGVVAVAVGDYHTCAVTSSGGVKCWGANGQGQLGDGTTTDRLTPVDVVGLAGGAVAVAAGSWHTCALTSSGGARCWGDNYYGQLGDGTTIHRTTPVDVSRLASGVVAVAAGGYHTCALTRGGGAKCWGYNGYGQVGDGTTTDSTTPVDVVGLASGVVAVTAGWLHTCALMSSGGGAYGVKCWGYNSYGQLGDGTTTDSTTPVDVVGLASGVITVAAGGQHTCALMSGGGLKCWGDNRYGQLGDNTTNYRATPVDVTGLMGRVVAVAAGYDHTCAVTSGGGVKCWGANYFGQLGDNTMNNSATPVDVGGLASGVMTVAAGNDHTCAVMSGGGVKCWGWNGHGQSGGGGLASGVIAVAAGGEHTCALTSGGGLKCWGDNDSGQLGDGTRIDSTSPVDVRGLESGVVAVAAGLDHTCAVTSGGRAKCWGANYFGQLGVNPGWTSVIVLGFWGAGEVTWLPLVLHTQ
jgi:alpha-tubulin suppressor-like RCC1 family protein